MREGQAMSFTSWTVLQASVCSMLMKPESFDLWVSTLGLLNNSGEDMTVYALLRLDRIDNP